MLYFSQNKLIRSQKLNAKPSILVVEDEKDMRENLSDILKDRYKVLSAANGLEAIKCLEDNFEIRVVLLDIKLTDISGIEVLKKIKKSGIDREVIMVTALNDLQIAVETMKDGAYDYITKPFHEVDLISTIDRALESDDLASRYKGLLTENLAGRIDRDRRYVLFQELRMKKRVEGTAVPPADLLKLFPYHDKDGDEKELSFEELKRSLEKDADEKSEQEEKATVLVVEDESDMRENIKDGLSGKYNILTAENGSSALEQANKNKNIDIALLDIRLPDISGIDLILKIKEKVPGVDIIMVTALNDVDTAVKALKNGAYDYITKPFLQTDLLYALERTLEKRYYQKVLPALYEKLKEKKLSYEQRFMLLNELCEKRKAEGKEILMDDIYVFFPEHRNPDLPGSFSIPPKTIETGLREFLDNLKLRAEKMPNKYY